MAKKKTKPAARRSRNQRALVTPKESAQPHPPEQSCIVVGVGASAGGLEAFSQLLRHLPPDTGMAFVLVQHLDPKHPSILTELLGRTTNIPVAQVTDGMGVEANHVYVIPPNTDMAITKGILKLQARPDLGGHTPIDHFLYSLAEDQGARSIGVILSGTASDGTLGMKAIKAEGGITFAQDSKTAKYDGMPRSAVAAGCIDFVMAPEGIARELVRIARHPYLAQAGVQPADVTPSGDDEDFRKILALLARVCGTDFTHYKHATIRRRVMRRMVLARLENLSGYYHRLRDDPQEVRALYHDILISVTSFFREPEAYQALRKLVLSNMLKDRSRTAPIRVWVPGCSTGEEAYSIAICLVECLQETGRDLPIQLFATDISDAALERARQGVYTEASIRQVSAETLRRFFVRVDRGYQVNRALREMCVFARQDVTKDPPFSKVDLISCRNVLIYLGAVLQRRVLSIFHYALKPTGFLMLGASETINAYEGLFGIADRKWKIYTRKPVETPRHLDLPLTHPEGIVLAAADTPVGTTSGTDLQKEADRIVLDRYAPAGVVIDRDMRILQFRGQTGPYLQPAPGEASFHLLRMAREGLAVDLRTAIHAATKNNVTVRKQGIKVRHNGQWRNVNVEVAPLRPKSKDGYFLVLFSDATPPPAPAPAPKTTAGLQRRERGEIVKLQQELESTKQYLQAIIEEQEASNEELKSANEEIQSSNEELQSTNEELETAKEELQSANEELTTVNEELQNRNAELTQVNDDLSNLLSSVNIPIVMLGSDLCIRRVTPLAEKVWNVISTDVGRPVTDLKPNIELPDLADRIRGVIETLNIQKLDVADKAGHWYTLWIRPYRTAENKIDGVVLVLVDTDEIRRSLEQVRASHDFTTAILDTIRSCIVVLDQDLRVKTANHSFYETFANKPEEVEGRPLLQLGGGQWDIPELRLPLEDVAAHNTRFEDFEMEHTFPGLGRKALLVSARPIDRQRTGGGRILLSILDETRRKEALAELRSSQERFGQLADRIRDVFYVRDVSTNRFLYVSPAYESIWGRTPGSLYADPDSWIEAVHPEDRQRVREATKAVPEVGFRLEHRVVRPDGMIHWVSVSASPLLDEAGRVTRVAGMVEDITESKRLEEELRQSQKMEVVGGLAGSLAHDFNNLLTAIGGYCELLLEETPPDDPRHNHVLPIQEAAQRAAELTRKVLAYSRRQVLQPEIVDLNELVSNLGNILRPLIGVDVELITVLAPNLHPIQADPTQLEQVILNLAVNARDAMPNGGRLTIETANTGPKDSHVLLRVSDTGHGMDAETQSRIFEPFFTTKPMGQGTGLGLATVYGTVKQSGGEITVASKPGRGTTFTILLPRAAEAVAPAPAPAVSLETLRGSETILLTEDEEWVRKLAREVLEKSGYTVLEAASASEALQIGGRAGNSIDLVITDVVMPQMRGPELVERLLETHPGMKVLFISGYSEETVRRQGSLSAPKNFLQKPFTSVRLLEEVRKALQSSAGATATD